MNTTDADLIDKLNSLPEEQRTALLEFLGATGNTPENAPRDRLAASAWMHGTVKNLTDH